MRGLSRAICLVAAAGVGALPANDAQSTLHKLSSSSNTMVRSMPIINATRIHTVHSSFATATQRLNTTSVSPTVTSTETNKFGFSGTSTATFHSASSTVTLAPNVHWTQDTKEVKNVIPLSPEEGSQMYYGTGDPLKKGQFGLITYNFISPSVNLDHSDWIKVDYDENEGLKVTFTNQDAFNHAKKTWLPKDKGLILIVFIDACEAYKSGERCYFKASNLDVSPDDMTIMVSAEPRHPNDLITSGESQWGWWDPSEGSSLATNPSKKAGNEQCQAGNDGPTNDFLKHIHPDTTSISDNGANDRRSIWSWIDDHVVKPIENDAKEILGDMTISDDFNKSLPFKFPESGTGPSAVSPWGGDSMLLWSIGSKSKASVDVYCVGCGVSGDARISGKVKWTPATGFTEGEADLHLDAQFSLKIGVDAHAQFSQSFSKEVFEHTFNMTAFGGFSIIPTIGVNVTADIAAAAQADGKLLAGAEMGLQDAHVIFDLVEPSRNDVGGWWPYFKPVLQADGDVMVSASIGLPIRVSCQVSMGFMSVAATVIDEPSVNATAQAAAWAELDGGKVNWGFNDTDGCTGVRTRLSWRNKLLADVKSAIYSGKILLWDSYDRPLGPSCIPLPGGNTMTASTTTVTSTTVHPTPPATASEYTTMSKITTTPNSAVTSGSGFTTSGAKGTSSIETGAIPVPLPTSSFETGTIPIPSPTACTPCRCPVPSSNGENPGSQPSIPTQGIPDSSATNHAQPVPDKSYTDTNGFQYGPLANRGNTVKLMSCSNGDTYAARAGEPDSNGCSDQWTAQSDKTIVSDGSGRMMHYFNDTMSTLGVSKLSVCSCAKPPATGVWVALAPYQNHTAPDAARYVAVDPYKHVYYPVVCGFTDKKGSQVFLVNDPAKGIQTLQSAASKSVTGYTVDKCHSLVLSPAR